MTEIPRWLSGVVDAQGAQRIEEAVRAAEQKTSAEIVPMIVHRSITTGHVGLVLFLAQLVIFWLFLPWLTEWTSLSLAVLEVILTVIAAISAFLQKDLDFWERLLTPKADQELSVMRRAQLEFYQSNIKATSHSTGVLILVSYLEHRAVVLADQAVSEKYPPETWENLIRDLIGGIKQGDFVGGMTKAIDHAAVVLSEKFPDKPGAHNQLADKLVIRE